MYSPRRGRRNSAKRAAPSERDLGGNGEVFDPPRRPRAHERRENRPSSTRHLTPPPTPPIKKYTAPASPLALIKADPSLSTFAAAIKAANLTSKLDNPETVLSVFAPNDAAFDSYLEAAKISKAELLASPDLKYILKQHVVKATAGLKSSKWMSGQPLKSWLSEMAPIVVAKDGDKVVSVSSAAAGAPSAKFVKLDLPAGAGSVHVIDAVLSPPKAVVDSIKVAAKAPVASASVAGRKMLAV